MNSVITERKLIFYCGTILLVSTLGISSYFFIGIYISFALLFISLLLPFLVKDKIIILLWIISLVVVFPEELSDYFINMGYRLNNIYSIKFLNIGLIHSILIIALILILQSLHPRTSISFNSNIFYYLFLVFIMFYNGLIHQNNIYFILYDIMCFFYFFSYYLISTILVETEIFVTQIFHFIIFLLQLRVISAVIIDLIYPFLGAVIYDTFLSYLDIVVILIPFLNDKLFGKRSLEYKIFSILASLFAITEIIFMQKRLIFILSLIFFLLFVFGLFYKLKISKDQSKRILFKNIIRKLVLLLSMFVLVFVILLNLESSSPLILGAKYKFLSAILFTSLSRENPSINLRIYEFIDIWNMISENPFTFLFGYGAGSSFFFEYVTPPASFFGIGSYPESQILSKTFQPHTIVNFLLLKSGIIGFILYFTFYLSFMNKCFSYFKKDKDIHEELMLMIIYSSIPIFFNLNFLSIPVTFLSGVFYALLTIKYRLKTRRIK